MIERVLAKTGATVWYRRRIYKVVSYSVLLYFIEICVVTGDMIKVLEGFHHRAVRRIMGMTETRGVGREWEYPPVVAAMESAGIHPIRKYILRRYATIAEKVACCHIYELCAKAERIPRMSRMVRWWDQDMIN